MEFVSCIKDECGCVVALCAKMSQQEIDEILDNHPEWYLGCEAC